MHLAIWTGCHTFCSYVTHSMSRAYIDHNFDYIEKILNEIDLKRGLNPDEHELKKADYLQKWGDAAHEAGLYSESQTALEQSLSIRKELLPKDHPDVGTSLNNLALLYKSQGKYEEAEPLYQRCLEIREKSLGKDHPSVATTLNNLAALYKSQSKYDEAELLYQRCLGIYEKALGKDHPSYKTVMEDYSQMLSHKNKPK
ncbi:TPR repeat family protein [Candidatus Magnetomorum sp. HK-1]|nr:TPR repeat family protein [Candidatus Magnetomorum sp. HK-1]